MKLFTKPYLAFLTILTMLVFDQVLKIYIKTNIEYGDGFAMLGLEWARIHFVENEGMAFGLSYGGVAGKYVLSIFRIIMVGFLFFVLVKMIKDNESSGLIVSFSLIIAGALGNIIDCAFYGLVFSESYFHGGVAEFVPFGEGYGPFLQGKVVDMLYFPLIDTILPEWMPGFGGSRFEFFRPVFNIADTAISVGVISIILFHRSIFFTDKEKKEVAG